MDYKEFRESIKQKASVIVVRQIAKSQNGGRGGEFIAAVGDPITTLIIRGPDRRNSKTRTSAYEPHLLLTNK